jgi:hypothetical protein
VYTACHYRNTAITSVIDTNWSHVISPQGKGQGQYCQLQCPF